MHINRTSWDLLSSWDVYTLFHRHTPTMIQVCPPVFTSPTEVSVPLEEPTATITWSPLALLLALLMIAKDTSVGWVKPASTGPPRDYLPNRRGRGRGRGRGGPSNGTEGVNEVRPAQPMDGEGDVAMGDGSDQRGGGGLADDVEDDWVDGTGHDGKGSGSGGTEPEPQPEPEPEPDEETSTSAATGDGDTAGSSSLFGSSAGSSSDDASFGLLSTPDAVNVGVGKVSLSPTVSLPDSCFVVLMTDLSNRVRVLVVSKLRSIKMRFGTPREDHYTIIYIGTGLRNSGRDNGSSLMFSRMRSAHRSVLEPSPLLSGQTCARLRVLLRSSRPPVMRASFLALLLLPPRRQRSSLAPSCLTV